MFRRNLVLFLSLIVLLFAAVQMASAEDFTAATLQITINESTAAGQVTQLLAGTYVGDSNGCTNITLPNGTMLYGVPGTVFNNITLRAYNGQDIIVSGINFDGITIPYTYNASVVLLSQSVIYLKGNSSNITINGCIFNHTRTGSPIIQYSGNATGLKFLNNYFYDIDHMAIYADNNNDASLADYQGIYSINNTVRYAGYYARGYDWVTGYDFGEDGGHHHMRVQDLYVENTNAYDSWESGIHIEWSTVVVNATFKDCNCSFNGQKSGGAYFGAGFLVHNATLINCTANNELIGFNSNAATYVDCHAKDDATGYAITNGMNPNYNGVTISLTNCTDDNSSTVALNLQGGLRQDGTLVDPTTVSGHVTIDNFLSMNAQKKVAMIYSTENVYVNNFTVLTPVSPSGRLFELEGYGSIGLDPSYGLIRNSYFNINYHGGSDSASSIVYLANYHNVTLSGYYNFNGPVSTIYLDNPIGTNYIYNVTTDGATPNAIRTNTMNSASRVVIAYFNANGTYANAAIRNGSTSGSIIAYNDTIHINGTNKFTGTVTQSHAYTYDKANYNFAKGVDNAVIVNRTIDLNAFNNIEYINSSGGNATAGVDYTTVSETLNYATGDTSKIVTVHTINASDGVKNLNLTLTSTMTSPLSNNTVQANILDWPIIGILSATYSGVEGSDVTITVGITGQILLDGNVTLTAVDGSAVLNTDYTPASHVLNFTTEDASVSCIFHLLDDGYMGGDKSFTATISSPTNATLRTNTTCTITVIDLKSGADTVQANKLFNMGWVLVLMVAIFVVFAFLGSLYLIVRSGNFNPAVMIIVVAGAIIIGLMVAALVLFGYISGEIIEALKVFSV